MRDGCGGREQDRVDRRHHRRQDGRDDEPGQNRRQELVCQRIEQGLAIGRAADNGPSGQAQYRHAGEHRDRPDNGNGEAAHARTLVLHSHQARNQLRLAHRIDAHAPHAEDKSDQHETGLPAGDVEIAFRGRCRERVCDAAETARGDQRCHGQRHRDHGHQRALQHVGHTDRPETAEQRIEQDDGRADQDGFGDTQAELGLEGDRGSAELGRDIENEAEQDEDRRQNTDQRAGTARQPRGQEVGRRDMAALGGFRPQAAAEEQPDGEITAPDARHHPQRGEPVGIDEAGKAQQHPGRGCGGGIGQAGHPGAQPLACQEEIAFGAIAPRGPDPDAHQDQLVGDQRRQNDQIIPVHPALPGKMCGARAKRSPHISTPP